MQAIYKPGSVVASHLSSLIVAHKVERIIARISQRETVPKKRYATLQQTGFTASLCHHKEL